MNVQIDKGWLRVWVIASCIWAAGATYAQVENYEDWYDNQTVIGGTEILSQRIFTREEEKRLSAYYLFRAVGVIAGPPLAIPAGIILVMGLGQWVRNGFDSKRKQ